MHLIYALPETTLGLLLSFLLGADVFCLSHASSEALRLFSQDVFWAPRMSPRTLEPPSTDDDDSSDIMHFKPPPSPPLKRFKQAYLTSYSFMFKGSKRRPDGPVMHTPVLWARKEIFEGPFTVDMWFSLSTDRHDHFRGGILLGAQTYCSNGWGSYPSKHAQYMLVDNRGDLYCSFLNEVKKPIAQALETGRWYHLAIVLDGGDRVAYANGTKREYLSGHQSVYLNGELVSSLDGDLHNYALAMYHWQIGAGFIHSHEAGWPRGLSSGMYGFHGMIDDIRAWYEAFSHDQVRLLTSADHAASEPEYSLKRFRDVVQPGYGCHVRCSRPRELVCVLN